MGVRGIDLRSTRGETGEDRYSENGVVYTRMIVLERNQKYSGKKHVRKRGEWYEVEECLRNVCACVSVK